MTFLKIIGKLQLVLTLVFFPALIVYQIVTMRNIVDYLLVVLFVFAMVLFEVKTYLLYSLIRRSEYQMPKSVWGYYTSEWIGIQQNPAWNMQMLRPIKKKFPDVFLERSRRKINQLTYVIYILLGLSIILEIAF